MAATIMQGYALPYLLRLPSNSVDLFCTDPPYSSLEKHRAVGTTTRLTKAWFPVILNSDFPQLLTEMYRVLKSDRHFYMFCDQETMFIVKPMAEAAGFKFWKPLIWDKKKIGMGYHYRCRHEFILFFEKGKRKLNNLSIPDVLECPRVLKGYLLLRSRCRCSKYL
jgi:site-specific DNA-methyltransferase (adenine-specific)